LKRACDILLEVLPENRLCGVARNIGREGQSFSLMALGLLRDFDAEMTDTLFIGNSRTRKLGGRMVTPRGYIDE
jgi:precorrin-3B C17-methyltransferase